MGVKNLEPLDRSLVEDYVASLDDHEFLDLVERTRPPTSTGEAPGVSPLKVAS